MKNIFKMAVVALMLAACGQKEKNVLELNATFTKEGPFMAESPETFQFELKTEIEDFLKSKGLNAEQISSVKIISAELNTSDSAKFTAFSTATLSMMAGGDSKAKEIGVKNPIKGADAVVKLDVAQDADMKEHFKSKGKFLTLDLTPVADKESGFECKAILKFEIETKK
jgi:hypothetical protein